MIAPSTLVLALCVLVVGTPVRRSLEVHETRDAIPAGFALQGAADPDTVLNLRLGLASSDANGLIEALYDVSSPSSTNYGQHLSKAEVDQYIAPKPETLAAVTEWLTENSVTATTLSSAGDWLAISVPVAQANTMLGAEFAVYVDQSSGEQLVRTLAYSIPTDLKGHLDLVHPTTTFAASGNAKLPLQATLYSSSKKRAAEANSACSDYVEPACLESLYGIPTTPATDSSNYIVVTGYDDEYPSTTDLQNFLENYRTDISSSTTYTVVELDDGSYDPSDPGDEADLDIQYTVGLATDVPVTFISVGESANDGVYGFLDTANYILDLSNPPSVMTTSYGSNEEYISSSVANKLCIAYASLGAIGVSVLFASGDGGVSGSQSESCTDFVPTFPSGCPYVTSVGATTGTDPETAASFSAGGFSNIFARPSFQDTAVSSYLTYLGSTYSGMYNTSGRAYPDVSTQGEDFIIGYEGDFYAVSGTSCASPTFASVIALLNDRLLAAGKSTLGWLNPFLYSTGASALTDITSGDNPGCDTNGFSATTGWDPVTGLGTPIFDSLLTAVGL
ncbi:family S53 protease-like protein [Laetiporus sulphureus 93-53]|uniref:tripeptidyl-peptidase II n=1 Tax=Laetiporus sulphureus 93-53 TaxID=1314785 RepID=A0A165CT69_9APHY|nr:family S53 protease-like protein [Laetiporus sulphureus 93-53]KZT03394.1 family S53 protease-like protein [Laetiporus sulphureus 93-53]